MNATEKKILKQLINILDAYENKDTLTGNQGQALDGYSALANFISIAEKARNYLSGKEEPFNV